MKTNSRTQYVLVDFENVQPRNLEILADHPVKLFVFVGGNQNKVSLDFAKKMQQFGSNGRYVEIDGSGKNALDFHIAYYLGQLSEQSPDADFHVISRDTGFDPLLRHLRATKIRVSRLRDLAEIPILRVSPAMSNDDKIALIVRNLATRGHARPRKVKTLANTINSLFTTRLEESELLSLVRELQDRDYIEVNGSDVSYRLPEPG